MTDKEKLQRLFDAALKDMSEVDKVPTRSFPNPSTQNASAVPTSEPVAEIQPGALPKPVEQAAAPPAANLGLDEKASAELATLLEAQNKRKASKRRRDALVTLTACIAIFGGGFGWFVQSAQRVQAFRETITEIRSAGDIAAILANYQKAVDRIGARADQINESTESMGVSSNQDGAKDPNLESEMLAMTGGEGKSVGQRNQILQEKFGKVAEAARAKTGPPEARYPTR